MPLREDLQQAQRHLAAYPVLAAPFEHYMVEGFFPAVMFERLLSLMPDDDAYVWGQRAEYGENARGSFLFNRQMLSKLPADQREFWTEVGRWTRSDALIQAVAGKFPAAIKARLSREPKGSVLLIEVKLIRDKVSYSLRPHTDAPDRVTTLMVYLPRDEQVKDHGTVIYQAKDPDLRCAGTRRHPFEDFERVKSAPFLPNADLGFLKSDRSFHGVEIFDTASGQRDLLAITIRCVRNSWKARLRRLLARLGGTEKHTTAPWKLVCAVPLGG